MIRRTIYHNVFDPSDRSQDTAPWRSGMRASDVIPVDSSVVCAALWHNGRLLRGEDPGLADGDFVAIAVAPGVDPFTWAGVFKFIFAMFAAYVVTSIAANLLLPKKGDEQVDPQAPDGSHTYYGFRNSYRSEGDALPVVYGSIRVAPPVINTSVMGTLSSGVFGDNSFHPSSSEYFQGVFAIGHGPIESIGSFTGDVFNDEDLIALAGGTAGFNPGAGVSDADLGMLVNGIEASHFYTKYQWRTGGMNQTPVIGTHGLVNWTDAGTTYPLGFTITLGTPFIDDLYVTFHATNSTWDPYYISGTYTYANRITNEDLAATQHVSQFLSTKADRCDVQLIWKKGLYNQQGLQTGASAEKWAVVRIQYWETDASDTTTGTTIITPGIKVIASTPSPFSVDVPFTFYDPATYTASARRGCALLDSALGDILKNVTFLGLAQINPFGGQAGFAVLPDAKMSFAGWVGWKVDLKYVDTDGDGDKDAWQYDYTTAFNRPTLWLWSWVSTPSDLVYYISPNTGDHPTQLVDPTAPTGDDAAKGWGVAVSMHRDVYDHEGFGTDQVYLRVHVWEQTGGPGVSGGYRESWWISDAPFGHYEDWCHYLTPTHHVGFEYDQSTFSFGTPGGAIGAPGTLRAWKDGFEVGMKLGHPGSHFVWSSGPPTPNTNFTGTGNGYLIGNKDSIAGQQPVHVPWRFKYVETSLGHQLTIGGFQRDAGTGDAENSRGFFQDFVFYNGLLSDTGAWYANAHGNTDIYGHKTYSAEAVSEDDALKDNATLTLPMNVTAVVGGVTVYDNFSKSPIAGSHPDLEIADATNTPKDHGVVWAPESGTPKLAYWHVEIHKESPTTEGPDSSDVTTIDTITTWVSQTYNYPGVAYLTAQIQANDQLNSTEPTLSFNIKGLKVRIWDGKNEDSPIFKTEWSNNPAWVVLDLLTNSVYGMGSIIAPNGTLANIHLPSFLDWANFCDEGAADGFGALEFFGLALSKEGVLGETSTYHLTFYVGLTDSSEVSQQTLPNSWNVGDFQSITAITASGIDPDWITSNDLVGGLNDASNKLLVETMTGDSDDDFHGWDAWMEIKILWNRVTDANEVIYPEGVGITDTFFADDYVGLTSLGEIGQYENRCTFDGVFDGKSKRAWDGVLDVFQAGRAMPVKVGRRVMAVFDRPRDAVGLFGQANIIEGSMEITYLSPDMNPNSIEAEILDRDHGFERRTVLVDHPSIQDPAQFGEFRKERHRPIGVTRRSQAIRDATYRLNKYALVRRMVKFSVGPDAIHILPGDRILVAHDVPQYGFSGRLAGDLTVMNIHPGALSLFSSWTQQGGDCVVSARSQMEDQAGTAPPETDYLAGVTWAYAVPTANVDAEYKLAGEYGASGWERQPGGTQQHICVGDGLYIQAGVAQVDPPGPFDRIDFTEQIKEFSGYFKEPTTGASESVRLNVYRFVDDEGEDVLQSHGVRFDWDGTGALVFGGYMGPSGPTSYAISSEGSGWYRATVFYDNDGTSGGGSAAVGDFIQARITFADDSDATPTFITVGGGGRGNQFLYFGDPLSVVALQSGAGGPVLAWGSYNTGVSGNSIADSTTIAPPFYTSDTGSNAGKRGYVVQLTTSASLTSPATPASIVQAIPLPTGDGVSSWNGERLCFTCYARLDASNAATNTTLYIDLRDRGVALDSNNLLLGDGIRATITMVGTPALSSVSKIEDAGTVANETGAVAALVQTSTTNDSDWVQINISFDYTRTSGTMTTLGVGVWTHGTDTGTALSSVDIWGLRLHGAGGSSATPAATDLVNPYAHRGALMWGPLYQPSSDGTPPDAFSDGATLKLDRDVTFDAGESYEIYVRSSFQRDVVLQTDTQGALAVSETHVPSSGSTTLAAGSDMVVAEPASFYPVVGDVYSFGKSNQAVEDFIVNAISTDAEKMVRVIEAAEYVAEVYDDNEWGTLGDVTVSALPETGTANAALYGMGGSGPTADAFSVEARARPYRDPNGGVKPAVWISWKGSARTFPLREYRIWVSQLNGFLGESQPRFVATVPSSVAMYRFDDDQLVSGLRYRFRVQRIGFRGTGDSLTRCPYADVEAVQTPPLPPAPTVEVSSAGFRQSFRIQSDDTAYLSKIEARSGGWLIGVPVFIKDPSSERFTTSTTVYGPTNSAGRTNAPLVARGKLESGRYGQALIVTPAAADSFVDGRSTTTLICENDYASNGTVPSDLQVSSSVLQWDDAGPSTALGPVYYEADEIDLSTAHRVVVSVVLEGYQVRPETLADLLFTLDSDDGRRWSIEGPMDDDGFNSTVRVEWRWTSGSSLSGVGYRTFDASEVYLRKAQFRLRFERKTATSQVRVQRFSMTATLPPLYAPDNVDGGAF